MGTSKFANRSCLAITVREIAGLGRRDRIFGRRTGEVSGLDDLSSDLVAVVEHPPQFRVQQVPRQQASHHTHRRFVFDFVTEESPPLSVIEEEVTVIPRGKRALDLAIGEEPISFIFGVLGDPAQANRPERDGEDHPRSGLQRGPALDDPDPFPGRGEALQCPRALMEREDDFGRCRDPRLFDEPHRTHPDEGPPLGERRRSSTIVATNSSAVKPDHLTRVSRDRSGSRMEPRAMAPRQRPVEPSRGPA